MIARLFRKRKESSQDTIASLPVGGRLYAVGDIHGRRDLLDELLERIEHDNKAREPKPTTLLFLGDLIDRGPESAQVVERLLHLANERSTGSTRFLLGNHEEVFLEVLRGDLAALRFFAKIGGRETILSYGVTPAQYESSDYAELLSALLPLVPKAHLYFLSGFEDMIVLGDYAFVHAGVRPQCALDAQAPKDLRWIRNEFLDFPGRLEKVIVHGHTITENVAIFPHRIGLDTGAFASGKLTAMGFEADQRWIIQVTR